MTYIGNTTGGAHHISSCASGRSSSPACSGGGRSLGCSHTWILFGVIRHKCKMRVVFKFIRGKFGIARVIFVVQRGVVDLLTLAWGC